MQNMCLLPDIAQRDSSVSERERGVSVLTKNGREGVMSCDDEEVCCK